MDDVAQVRHWAHVIGGRYMGVDRAEEFGRRNGVPGELLIRVHVDRVVAKVDVADSPTDRLDRLTDSTD